MSTITTSPAQRRRLSPPRHRTPNYRLVESHDLVGRVTFTWCAMPLRSDRRDFLIPGVVPAQDTTRHEQAHRDSH